MDKATVLELARITGVLGGYEGEPDNLERFAAAVAAAVKEEDAKFIDAVGKDWEEACVEEKVWAAEYLSAAIRTSVKE